MTEPLPIVELVVGIADNINFMNVLDPQNPIPLSLKLDAPSRLVFRLSDELIRVGWTFQKRPILFTDDFGINFSSYTWIELLYDVPQKPFTCFMIDYEDNRVGEYIYSLFMTDSHRQNIILDPKIENGGGKVP
ncbi:hypothetical protein [Caulobacter sp. BK020]|uniref:hypothetical protein n=1 Tax=Caulobacter sp. BK020 TaxID=2512117 RepID=UPI0010EA06EF|nr:hypothetical protein [Caulobacter sp. BK020]TCS17487.1 hypothetical protein EV278_102251 [Caulobacter sp. BK020]